MAIDYSRSVDDFYPEDEPMSIYDDAMLFIESHAFDENRVDDPELWEEMMDVADSIRTIRDLPENKRGSVEMEHIARGGRTLLQACEYIRPGVDWTYKGTDISLTDRLADINSQAIVYMEGNIEAHGKQVAKAHGVEFRHDFMSKTPIDREPLFEDLGIADMPKYRAKQGGVWSEADARFFGEKVAETVEGARDTFVDNEYASDGTKSKEAVSEYYRDTSDVFAAVRAAEITSWPEKGDVEIVSEELRDWLGDEYEDYVDGLSVQADIDRGLASGNMTTNTPYSYGGRAQDLENAHPELFDDEQSDELSSDDDYSL